MAVSFYIDRNLSLSLNDSYRINPKKLLQDNPNYQKMMNFVTTSAPVNVHGDKSSATWQASIAAKSKPGGRLPLPYE
jgi:hypothetical protein